MLTNYFKLALRGIRRRPLFSAINIGGLAVGLAACWLIALFVQHEQGYDQYLPQADRICAVALDLKMGDQEGQTTNTPPPLGLRLAADFPEIEMTARSFPLGSVVVRKEHPGNAPLLFNEENALAVDSGYLALFGFPMVAGDVTSALNRPGSLVMTEKMAEKYFSQANPVGQSLLVNDRLFTITGVLKNLPSNSSVQFGFLLPMADFNVVSKFSWSWIWLQVDTWAKLRQAPTTTSLAALEAKFPAMVNAHAPAAYERIGQNFEALIKKGDRYAVKLLPLTSLHLGYESLESRLGTLGDGQQVRLFGIVGALVLILACVNYMNLSTARSMQRAREVGVRKALGSQRSQLLGQFLSEALLFSTAAMVIAGVLAWAALPFFNLLTGLEMQLSDLFSARLLALVLTLPVAAALLGGLYPAFYLSKFKALAVMKPAASEGKGGHKSIRSSLVVFQFATSIVLMLSSFAVLRQLDFATKQSPGLQRENVLVLKNARHLTPETTRESFRQQLLQLPEVQTVTHSTFLPSLGSFGDFYEPEQGTQQRPVVQNLLLSSYLTDSEFMPTLGAQLVAGRNFLPSPSSDSNAVILNETAVKAIGWDDPIGKWMRYPGNENQRFQVVGVVRDFHIASVKTAIEPVAVFHESSKTYRTWGSYLAMRLAPGTEKTAIEKTAALWKNTVPGAPFEYDFLDASFASMYQTESKTASVLGVLTALALFIGCLGLFALAAFTAEQRTREIGVRKVLGASVTSITRLLARDFLKLVLLAVGLATPVAYYFMQKWLADFAYRIELQWWMFALAALAAMGIAFLTVIFQSIRAALADPVKSLRSE